MRPERGVGFGGPRRLLGHRLSNSTERANPSIFRAGPPSKDGCQMLRSSAKKTNKGTFKNSRVKEVLCCFFFFFPSSSLFSSLLHKLALLAVNDLFSLSPRGSGFRELSLLQVSGVASTFPGCGSLPSLQAGAGSGAQSAHSSSDAAGSPLPSFLNGRNLCRLH